VHPWAGIKAGTMRGLLGGLQTFKREWPKRPGQLGAGQGKNYIKEKRKTARGTNSKQGEDTGVTYKMSLLPDSSLS